MVEAATDVRMARGLERDGEAFRPHWQRWAAQERELFGADHTRDRADLIVHVPDRFGAHRATAVINGLAADRRPMTTRPSDCVRSSTPVTAR
ncbi:MAG: hypothetical protein R2742_13215 [Micropruina glycogenica]